MYIYIYTYHLGWIFVAPRKTVMTSGRSVIFFFFLTDVYTVFLGYWAMFLYSDSVCKCYVYHMMNINFHMYIILFAYQFHTFI